MKKIRFVLIIFLLLAFTPYIKGQEVQLMVVHKNGHALYSATLASSDSITFSKVTGVIINGTVWAACNVDMPGTFAAKPEEPGMFYQWNRRVGWSSTDPMVNSNGGTAWNQSMPFGSTWEKVNDPCPRGWRVPTSAEQDSLVKSNNFWGELNGVPGRFFGNGDQKVFFPATGFRQNDHGFLYWVGSHGGHWNSRGRTNQEAYNLIFTSELAPGVTSSFRTTGIMVRCVAE